MSAPVITNIEDLRELAKRAVPRMFYDYADSGSWTESTYRANEADFAEDQAAPARRGRHREPLARDDDDRHRRRDAGGARADRPAPACSTPTARSSPRAPPRSSACPFTLSTMSICSIEDVAANTTKPFWFQLYVMRDRDFIEPPDRPRQGGELLARWC